MKKGKRKKLVPITVMLEPDQIEWIKAQTYGTGDSMGRVIRQSIEQEIKARNRGEEKT